MKREALIFYYIGIILGTASYCFMLIKGNGMTYDSTEWYSQLCDRGFGYAVGVVCNRFVVYLILLLFCFVAFGRQLFDIYMGYFGFQIAFVAAVNVRTYGIKGVGIYLLSIFPHYIFYILSYMLIALIVSKRDNPFLHGRFWKIVILAFAGVFSECFFNAELLKKLVDIM